MQTARTSNSKKPQQKYRLGTVSIKPPGVWEGGGLKPVLRDPSLAFSFCYGSKRTVSCSVRVKVFLLINGSSRETNKSKIDTLMKQI